MVLRQAARVLLCRGSRGDEAYVDQLLRETVCKTFARRESCMVSEWGVRKPLLQQLSLVQIVPMVYRSTLLTACGSNNCAFCGRCHTRVCSTTCTFTCHHAPMDSLQ